MEAFLLLSAAYNQKNAFDEAARVLEDGIKANPSSVALNLVLADVFVKGKRPGDAIATMEHLVSLDPANAAHKLALAGLYWDNGKQEKATGLLQEVVSADKKHEVGRLQTAMFYLSKGKADEAERELTTGIGQNGKSFRLRLALSELYAKTNRADQAIKTLKDALTLDKNAANPDIIQVKNSLAKIYFAQRNMDEAKKYVDEILKESPKNLDAHFTRGDIYLTKGEGASAVTEFREVVTERPQFVPAYVKMAEAHAINNELNLASDTLLSALKIDPKSREATLTLVKVEMLQKEYDQAEGRLRTMVEANPNDLDARATLGDLYAAKKDPRAEAEYGQMKRIAPNNPSGYVKLAYLFASQGKLDKARGEFEAALKLSPDSPVASVSRPAGVPGREEV